MGVIFNITLIQERILNKNQLTKLIILAAAVPLLIMLSGCSTVNNLDEYDIYGKKIAMDMYPAPAPEVNVDYGNVDFAGDQLAAVVQLGTNLIKAGEAEKAEQKMKRALDGLYIPEYAAELTFDRIVKSLDGTMVDNFSTADIVLEIDVEEYGLESYSFNGEVSMFFTMTARFIDNKQYETIWQRRINVEQELSPGFFGFDSMVGNVVSIASLSSLEEDELAEGFMAMTHEIMRETINLLKKDLRKARS